MQEAPVFIIAWAPISEEQSRLEQIMAEYKIALEAYNCHRVGSWWVHVLAGGSLASAFLCLDAVHHQWISGVAIVIALWATLVSVAGNREAHRRVQARRSALAVALQQEANQHLFQQIYKRLTNDHARKVFSPFLDNWMEGSS